MAIALIIPDRKLDALHQALTEALPEVPIWIYPEIPDPAQVQFAVVWRQPAGSVASLPQLRALQSFGAGVDNILADASLPNLPLARIVDPDLTASMIRYVDTMLGYYRLRLEQFSAQQAQAVWKPKSVRSISTVTVLGLGELGLAVAQHLAAQGIQVNGWSRSAKHIEGIHCFSGEAGLEQALSHADVVVVLLPLTPETENLLDARRLGYCKPTAVLINVARGALIDDQALLQQLNEDRLAAACLDVFRQEPLPSDHPFWQHPRIQITPHISAVTNAATAVSQIAENYRRVMQGLPLLHQVDRQRGY